MNEQIALELLQMIKRDMTTQDELIKNNESLEDYHPRLEKIHIENAERLKKIIYEIGWPTIDKVGEEASYAAWIILQHAISHPTLQRESLPLLMELANKDQIYPAEVAVLQDRICYFEMRPQRYGTQFDFDENDELNPWEIEDIENVDKFRKQVGLPPLDETIKRMQEVAKRTNEKPTMPYQERLSERIKWAKRVGWI